jgi:hypothetical protein
LLLVNLKTDLIVNVLQPSVPENELPELTSPQTGIPQASSGFVPLKNSIKLKLK